MTGSAERCAADTDLGFNLPEIGTFKVRRSDQSALRGSLQTRACAVPEQLCTAVISAFTRVFARYGKSFALHRIRDTNTACFAAYLQLPEVYCAPFTSGHLDCDKGR